MTVTSLQYLETYYHFTTFLQDESTNTHLYFGPGITGFDMQITDNLSFVKSESYSVVYQDYGILKNVTLLAWKMRISDLAHTVPWR
jgi:hypothetical protein